MTVPNGETVKVSFTVKVQKKTGGQEVKNTAIVREGENEYTTNDVVNSIPTPPTKDVYKTSKPTVSIDKAVVNPGDKLTYAIFYTNTTGEDADVTITDNIPAHTTFVSADNGGTFANGTATWNLKVKNGESVKVTFNVTVDEVTAGTDIKNTAKVIEGENEYNTNEVINTVPTPKTGDEADYRAFRMHCFTLAGSLIVFLAALVMLILNRKKEKEFLSKK